MRPSTPRLRTSTRTWLAIGVVMVLAAAPSWGQTDRRRTTPGLVLETGARHAACDVLLFTPDGKELLAAGDDKVVRVWKMTAAGLDGQSTETLRWPIFRESRGSIFALALAPNGGGQRLAVAGIGIKNGLVAVLDRGTDKVERVLQPENNKAVWALAFSPDGKHLAFGADDGSVWAWDLAGGGTKARALRPPPADPREVNRVRLLAFLNGTRFLSVAEDGLVLEWDLAHAGSGPKQRGKFQLPHLFCVTLSPDKKLLAAAGQAREGETGNFRRVELLTLGGGHRFLDLPDTDKFPHCLAFDRDGTRLAVGARVVPQDATFFKEIGGRIYVFDLPSGQRSGGLEISYRPEALAFHPRKENLLASAGGDNHEVCLWDVAKKSRRSEVRGPGSSLWGVTLSADGRYLGFQEKRARNPKHPNDWGAGPWRVFDLQRRHLLPNVPADFKPVRPHSSAAGWKMDVDTKNAYVWNVVDPSGKEYPLAGALYNANVNNVPRCYTFLPSGNGKPPRLAVGHNWGISLYELTKSGPRLARRMDGHEGEVMALAPSADGRTLVSASRDQTLAGWSLADWPAQRELGASFTDDKKLIVRDVDPGSPAWEAGLIPGDEVFLLFFGDGRVYNPRGLDLKTYKVDGEPMPRSYWKETIGLQQAYEGLRNAVPGRLLVFVWEHKKQVKSQLTTVRQRPLWKFYPTRKEEGGEWLFWRWRDYYYDCSAQGDRFAGWHVNAPDNATDQTPHFHPLEHFRDRFHKPAKVWEALAGFVRNPEAVPFADIEPPQVKLAAAKTVLKDEDLVLTLTATPRGKDKEQQLARVVLWLDDYLYPLPPLKNGGLGGLKVTVPKKELRQGANRLTLVAFNQAGGRGQDVVTVTFTPKEPERGHLYALCVGITDYRTLKGFKSADPQKTVAQGGLDLPAGTADARAVRQALLEQDKLYAQPRADALLDKDATARSILKHLKDLEGKVHRQDTLVLFLAGHGFARKDEPESWFFACHDTDRGKADSYLNSRQLFDQLKRLKCRKLILLDTCHSGAVAVESDPVRALSRDGIPLFIYSACGINESSIEVKGRGLFTGTLLAAVQGSDPKSNPNKDEYIDAQELADYLRAEVPRRYREVLSEDSQTPVIYPRRPGGHRLFHKPEANGKGR